MSRHHLLFALAVCALAPACRKGPTYDDAPIARDDRPHATKKNDPKIEYDREEVCKQLGSITGTKALPEDETAELREMCLRDLIALKGRNRAEFDCRCKCILSAPDIGAIEVCQRRCVLENIDAVCEHAVGSQEKSNEGKVVDEARRVCVEKLKRQKAKDQPSFDCLVRCLMLADGKDASLKCDETCDPKNLGKPPEDAGVDAPTVDP